MIRRLITATATAIAIVVATTVLAPSPLLSAQTPDEGGSSGLAWMSGAHVVGGDPARSARFAEWRGRPLDVAVFWPDRATWADLATSPTYRLWTDAAAADPAADLTWVLGMPMFPTGIDGSIADCAAGAYDDEWRDVAAGLLATGHAERTIIRLAWEFNGTWYPWSAVEPTSWISCWRRVVTAAESVAPALRWDWNVNAGWTASTADASYLWPGDEFVDIVGVDSYDQWPAAVDEETWYAGQYLGEARLKHWLDFAVAHGKQLSVPEWGVSLSNPDFGTPRLDNALYVEKMFEFFRANAEHIAYEAYFNEPDPGQTGSLFEPVQAPLASAAYLASYHPGVGPEPPGGTGDVELTVHVPESDGPGGGGPGGGDLRLAMSAGGIDLGALQLDDDRTTLSASGRLGAVTVTDGRAADPGWCVTGQLSDLTGSGVGAASIDADRLGWTPETGSTSPGQTVWAGDVAVPGAGLGDARELAGAPAGSGTGTAVLDAVLALTVPTATQAGVYTGVLTLTVI